MIYLKYDDIKEPKPDNIVIYNGEVNTLQHEKDQVKEVKKDMDCGITLTNCQDYKEKDIIEVYELVEIKK